MNTSLSQLPEKPLRLLLVALGLTQSLPILAQAGGSVEIYNGYLSRDAWRYANIIGENRKGPVQYLDFDFFSLPQRNTDEPGYLQIAGRRLGLDTPRLAIKAGQYGIQQFSLHFRGTPSYTYNDARTVLRDAGSTQLSLPPDWQAGGTTAGMTNVQQSLTDLNLWRKRRTLELDYLRHLDTSWTLTAGMRRDEVDGMRSLAGVSGATGGNVRSALIPAPLAYETHIAALGIAYHNTALHLQLAYLGSTFNNGSNFLRWPAPFSRHAQWAAGTGFPVGQNQLALEPDNQAHHLSLNGSVNLGGSKRLYFDAMAGRQEQNDTLLPYTINPQLNVPLALPRTSADAKVNTTRINLRLNSRPLPRLNLVSRLGYRERDNDTPQEVWQRVRGDAINQQLTAQDARLNRPYSLTITKAGMDAAYRLGNGLRLDSSYEYTDTNRDYSEIKDMNEHSIRVGLRSTNIDNLALTMDYQHQRRRTGSYDGRQPLLTTHLPGTVAEEDFENHPLLRKYYLNERDRDQWRLNADWYVSDSISIGTALALSKDEYPSGYFGLNEAKLGSATMDINYTPVEDVRLSAFLNHDRYRYQQSGRSFRGSVPVDAFNSARNWQVSARDIFNTAGISIQRDNLRPRLGNWQAAGNLDLSMDISHSRSSGEFDNSTGADLTSAALPALGTRLDNLVFSARYNWSAVSSLRIAFVWESYQSDDFALDNVVPTTTANVLLLGQTSPHYQAGWTNVSYRYQF